MTIDGDGLFGLTEIQADVLFRRFGLVRETLDQIGRSWGLTRERIRQIQQESQTRIRSSRDYRCALQSARLLLMRTGYLTSETAALCAQDVSSRVSDELSLAIGSILVSDMGGGGDEQPYTSVVVRDEQIRLALENIQMIVDHEVLCDPCCSKENVAKTVAERPEYFPVTDWIRDLVVDLWPALRSHADREIADKRRHATGAELAREVLLEAGRPLHWIEVGQRVNRKREQLGLSQLSERSIHGRLQSKKELFSYFDQGTYGLRDWGVDVPYIRELMIQILESAGNPLTQSEIANEARKVREVKDSSLTFYLSLHPDFYCSRSGKYGLPAWLDPNPTIRTSRDYVAEPGDLEKRLNSSFGSQG